MSKALTMIVCLLASLQAMATGTVTFSGSRVQDGTGTLLASGKICGRMTDAAGNPIAIRLGGSLAGTAISQEFCATIAAGVFSMSVPDTSLTTPANACMNVYVKNNATGSYVVGNPSSLAFHNTGYNCLQPTSGSTSWCSGGTCNFDNYLPGLAGIPLVSIPGGTLPAGGSQYDTLEKSSSTDYAVNWTSTQHSTVFSAPTTSLAGYSFTGHVGGTGAAGGGFTITTGAGGPTGNNNGGDITFNFGAPNSAGRAGRLNVNGKSVFTGQIDATGQTFLVNSIASNNVSSSAVQTAQLTRTVNSVPFSATPTFDSTFDVSKITLTGNVTSSSITVLAGQVVTFIVCQDGTGGRTFAWPTNVKGTTTIGSTANKCTVQQFIGNDAADVYYAVAAGVTNQ